MQINRRDALKTIGVTGTALVTLNGEALAKTAEPKFPFTYRLGWFGKVKCSEPTTIKRKTLLNARGFEIKPKSIGWTFISDKGLKSIHSEVAAHLCLQKMLIFLHPKPKHTSHIYFADWRDEAIFIQSWDQECHKLHWIGRRKNHNLFSIIFGKDDTKTFEFKNGILETVYTFPTTLNGGLCIDCQSGFDYYDENGKILMTIDIIQREDFVDSFLKWD